MFVVEKDNKIIMADTDYDRLKSTLSFMPDCAGCEIVETDREIAELDGMYVYADTAEYKEAKNAEIAKVRGNLYAELIDPLHAQKQRKAVLGEWTEEMEVEYAAQVKQLTEQIQTENPYIEKLD
jgi:hypothetical protein